MKRYQGNETVGPGLYFNLRQLSFKSMEREGRLPGTENEVYHGVPWLALVVAGPILGLIYVIFLPFIGLAAILGLLGEKVGELLGGAAASAGRALKPGWEPARAFLSRSKRRKARAPRKPADKWADEVRSELEKDDRDKQ